MFSRSPKMKLLWWTKTGLPAPTFSTTRWWSKWEVIKHLHDAFGDILSFVEEEDLPPSRLKIQEIFDDPPRNRKLQIKIAITVDAGETFPVTLKVMVLLCSPHTKGYIAALRVAISNQYYPNTNAARQPSSHHSHPIDPFSSSNYLIMERCV